MPVLMYNRPPYDASLTPLARRLRKQMTKSERRLWNCLRSRQMRGHRFYRQFIIGRFIVDFYCKTLNIAIEVDGLSHDAPEAADTDADRQARLEEQGISVLRFPAGDVMADLDNVVRAIDGCVQKQEAQRKRHNGN